MSETGNRVGTRRHRFLLDKYPPGLERNAPHVQITDNYITNTRMRLRKIRVPESRLREYHLTQVRHPDKDDPAFTESTDIVLSASEYEVISVFEGNELRKNRFEYEFDGRRYLIDFYLGPLWGLFIAQTEFALDESVAIARLPEFALADITHDPLFSGPRLTELTIADIRKKYN